MNSSIKKILAMIVALILVIGISGATAFLVNKSETSSPAKIENGLSAYELAVKYGYEGTVSEWIERPMGEWILPISASEKPSLRSCSFAAAALRRLPITPI